MKVSNILLPTAVCVALLAGWELFVWWARVPAYTLPAPSAVIESLIVNWDSLMASWWFTVKITLSALGLACLGGVLIASVFALSPATERALFPLAVVLQVEDDRERVRHRRRFEQAMGADTEHRASLPSDRFVI